MAVASPTSCSPRRVRPMRQRASAMMRTHACDLGQKRVAAVELLDKARRMTEFLPEHDISWKRPSRRVFLRAKRTLPASSAVSHHVKWACCFEKLLSDGATPPPHGWRSRVHPPGEVGIRQDMGMLARVRVRFTCGASPSAKSASIIESIRHVLREGELVTLPCVACAAWIAGRACASTRRAQ